MPSQMTGLVKGRFRIARALVLAVKERTRGVAIEGREHAFPCRSRENSVLRQAVGQGFDKVANFISNPAVMNKSLLVRNG